MMRPLTDEHLAEVLDADRAVIYKHSPACWSGLMAMRQMKAFAKEHAGVPVWVVDVLAQRPLARAIAERTGIRHESPQTILICGGAPAWHDSHFGVRADELAKQVTRAECAPA